MIVCVLLTANLRRGAEGRSDLWVHGDHEVFLLRHACITLFDLVADPAAKDALEHSGYDVTDPIL